jgi:hypothetical protein
MGKGTTAWRNLLLLKWARASNIYLIWFVLWGFPGEDDAWYAEMAEWLPLIAHLQPSGGLNKVAYDRYSPYEFNAASYGLDLQPVASLRAVYPMMTAGDLRDQSYFFDDANELIDGHPWQVLRAGPRHGLKVLNEAHDRWAKEFFVDCAVLTMEEDGEGLRIADTRRCAPASEVLLNGIARLVYLACDEGAVTSGVVAALEGAGHVLSTEKVEAALAGLREQKLLVTLDGYHVALALRVPLVPWKRTGYPGGEIDVAVSRRIEEERRPSIIDSLLAEV